MQTPRRKTVLRYKLRNRSDSVETVAAPDARSAYPARQSNQSSAGKTALCAQLKGRCEPLRKHVRVRHDSECRCQARSGKTARAALLRKAAWIGTSELPAH